MVVIINAVIIITIHMYQCRKPQLLFVNLPYCKEQKRPGN